MDMAKAWLLSNMVQAHLARQKAEDQLLDAVKLGTLVPGVYRVNAGKDYVVEVDRFGLIRVMGPVLP